MRLIPAIDLIAGRCVRLLHGDFGAETRYAADPAALLEKYRDFGADWLHVVDLDGARDGTGANASSANDASGNRTSGNGTSINRGVITDLARLRPPLRLQVGGGLRDAAAVAAMFEAGAARAVVGSAAVTEPARVRGWLREYGPERVTLAFDVRLAADNVPRVATHGWRAQSRVSLWDAVARYADDGLQHVLCTDVARDGALSGPNVALYEEAVRRFPAIEWQASGGIRDVRDLAALQAAGAAAAISGKALLDELIPLEELQPFLPNA